MKTKAKTPRARQTDLARSESAANKRRESEVESLAKHVLADKHGFDFRSLYLLLRRDSDCVTLHATYLGMRNLMQPYGIEYR